MITYQLSIYQKYVTLGAVDDMKTCALPVVLVFNKKLENIRINSVLNVDQE